MRKTIFAIDQYYHIYNRGVDKRIVFMGKRDYERFLYLLAACNDTTPLLNSQFYYRGFASIERLGKRQPLVDILCFCLMPNHYHLLLKQKEENGISRFMQKLGTGYTMYFNTKYKRNGVLFQGVFKSIHVDTEIYLTHLSRYIHLNPVEFCEPLWKKNGIRKTKETHDFIKKYPWSSYCDYLGENRFTHILNKDVIAEIYPRPSAYELFMKDWIAKDFTLIGTHTLE